MEVACGDLHNDPIMKYELERSLNLTKQKSHTFFSNKFVLNTEHGQFLYIYIKAMFNAETM